MNIMLASVLERIREIGVRRAVGATQNDILFQFLSEAVLISVAGGVAGILFGTGISLGIERLAGITTIVSLLSVLLAFGVSITVGIGFGIVPNIFSIDASACASSYLPDTTSTALSGW